MLNHKFLKMHDSGMSLLEVVVSFVIVTVAALAVIPIFLNYKLQIIENEIELGAVASTRLIMEDLRQEDIDSFPESGSFNTLPSGQQLSDISYNNKTYDATVTYCQDVALCDQNTRHINVEIFHNNQSIYQAENVFTRLQ